MSSTSPLARLTVLLVTFNHANYVRKSIESILRQRIDEGFDIVVADDGSTDTTVGILRSYAEENPQVRFTFLDSSTNLGITRNYQRAFAACRNEYVAVMEGDDYWSSPYKLARQRDFLDDHWECDLCSVNLFAFDEGRCRFTLNKGSATSGHTVHGARELIAGNFIRNFSTCMYRQTALASLPSELFDVDTADWGVNICVARGGLIGFINEPMAVHRVHSGGSWSGLSLTEALRRQLSLIPQYDALTDEAFHPDFLELAHRLQKAIDTGDRNQLYYAPPVENPLVGERSWLKDVMPPIAVTLARLVFPPAANRYFVARAKRSLGAFRRFRS